MILVTGTSGRLGSLILHHLHRRAVPAVGGSRTPGPGGLRLDFDDPGSLHLPHVDTLVLVSAGYGEDDVVIARHRRMLDAARRDGVAHVIYTSLVTEGEHVGFALAHRATERMVRGSGMAWTILRNGLYAELIGALLMWEHDAILSPFAQGHVAAPTRDDLAQAAALVAAEPGAHAGRTHDLTGPAFTATGIAHALDAPVTELSLSDYRTRLLQTPGLLPFQPPMLAGIATSVRHGFLANDHPDLACLLGRPPVFGLRTAIDAAVDNRPQ